MEDKDRDGQNIILWVHSWHQRPSWLVRSYKKLSGSSTINANRTKKWPNFQIFYSTAKCCNEDWKLTKGMKEKNSLLYFLYLFNSDVWQVGGYHPPPTLQANWCGNDLIKGKYPVSCPIVPCHECHDTHVTVSWHASTDWLVFYCKN